jgi:hypothetical protein
VLRSRHRLTRAIVAFLMAASATVGVSVVTAIPAHAATTVCNGTVTVFVLKFSPGLDLAPENNVQVTGSSGEFICPLTAEKGYVSSVSINLRDGASCLLTLVDETKHNTSTINWTDGREPSISRWRVTSLVLPQPSSGSKLIRLLGTIFEGRHEGAQWEATIDSEGNTAKCVEPNGFKETQGHHNHTVTS